MHLVADIVSPDTGVRANGLDMVYRVLLAEAGFVSSDPRGRSYHLDAAEVASEALLSLLRRVEREGDGGQYRSLTIEGRPFRSVAGTFIRYAAAHLCRGEQRHRRNRGQDTGVEAADPSSFRPAGMDDRDARTHAVDVIRRMCSPAERKVVEALLASGWDTASAAAGLGVTTSYLYHTVRRLKMRLSELDAGWPPD